MTADGLLSHLHNWGGGGDAYLSSTWCVPTCVAIKFPGPFEGINFYLNKSNQHQTGEHHARAQSMRLSRNFNGPWHFLFLLVIFCPWRLPPTMINGRVKLMQRAKYSN
jgi:hypothetical protein